MSTSRFVVAVFNRMVGPRRRNYCFVLVIVVFLPFVVFIVDQLTSSVTTDVDIQVVVVEEHHEALEYWFNAANAGLISKKNNILIHIDAHPDDDNPENVIGMPFFRYPNTVSERRYFMQKNDVFIQGAIMSGLVSRFVWIWPMWDGERLEKAMPYEFQTVELGWYSDGLRPEFCRCEHVDVDDVVAKQRCVYNNLTTDEETTMSPTRCHVMTTYASEYLSTDHALERLAEWPNWIDGSDGVIIDIDEDFFGCESPSDELADRLGDGARSWRNVELINQALSAFLCPRSVSDESAANRFVRRLVSLVTAACSRETDRCRRPSLNTVVSAEFVGRASIFCGVNMLQVKAAWTSLSDVLARIPVTQLRTILDVGFCLNTAPRTHNFGREPNIGDFVVCYGANEPNSTLVYHHTPSNPELHAHMGTFDLLIGQLLRRTKTMIGVGDERRRPVQLVSMCRSVRDGYTPRSMATSIEDGILSVLNRHSGSMTIIHDRDLLGGREGWNTWLQ